MLESKRLADPGGLVSCLGLLQPVIVDIPGQVGVDAGTAAAIIMSRDVLVLLQTGK